MLSTIADGKVVIEFTDGGKEVLHPEEYAEVCGIGGGINFFGLIGLRTEFERSKSRPTEAERRAQRWIANYWKAVREVAKICRKMRDQRKRFGRVGYLPKRLNDAMTALSEIAVVLGLPSLDDGIRCQLEQDFSNEDPAFRRQCDQLVNDYAGRHMLLPMSELHALMRKVA